MATKYNMREVAQKLSEGQIDPNSTLGREIFAEIADRILRLSNSKTPQP